ncbi:hypothetical protein EUTSA_v10009851mg, partial [Eutrema salsugineum]
TAIPQSQTEEKPKPFGGSSTTLIRFLLSVAGTVEMAKSCKGLAEELVKCLSESICVKDEKRSIRDCAGEKSPCIPSECVGLRETYFNCKRGQVDMRARIRGNKGY